MSKRHLKTIKELYEKGFIAQSKLSDSNRGFLQPLLQTGILSIQSKGKGLAVFVNDYVTFETFIQTNFPGGIELDEDDVISRSKAISFLRDSKHGKLALEPVLINAKSNQFLKRNTEIFPVGELTEATGVASFLLDEKPENYWGFSGTIALIENLEVFVYWQTTGIPADIAIWTAGVMSQRIIKWLKSSQMKKCKIIHCGDYDPVGLNEFVRIYEQVGNKVSLFIPQEIESLFKRYSKLSLLQKEHSAGVFRRLRSCSHPDVIRIVNLIDSYNGGLEQEIILE